MIKRYDYTYQVFAYLRNYASANAPDQKSRNKVHDVLSSHSDMPYARDLLYSLHWAFDGLSNRSWGKALDSNNADSYLKHQSRADFYLAVSQWANACYDLVNDAEKEAPVITANIDAHSSGPQFDVPEKDAEDDSDPYVKPPTLVSHRVEDCPLYGPRPPNDTPSPKDTPMEAALDALQCRLLMADFGTRRVDSATALFNSVVLDRQSGATVLDVLERFGDEASELSSAGEYNAACFWDACVQISDDLRSDMAADMIKMATVTVPDMVWEPEVAGAMWVVAGDPDKALYRTEQEAVRAARVMFPEERWPGRTVRRRIIKTFK